MTNAFNIRLRNLCKVYPRQLSDQVAELALSATGRKRAGPARGGVALNHVSLSIHHGERVGIIGRNGAGKSTLLQMLAGVIEPTEGSIEITGQVTAVLTLGVGLREDLTGRQNIYLDGEIQGKTREEMDAEIDAVIAFADLDKFIDFPLRTYSTGMKARLAFAMITQIDPEILIIDETLSVGDAAFAAKAGKRISELCGKGRIVLIVSHSMQSIQALCNRCIWLQDGELIMDGHPDVVTAAYVESVREADQADLAARFRSLIGERSVLPNYHLTPLELFSGTTKVSRLTSGAALTVSSSFLKPETQETGRWLLRCIRIDGAIVLEQHIDPARTLSKHKIQITYPRFIVAPGVYRVSLEWKDDRGAVRAEASTMLEVSSDEVISGGRPVLLYRGTVECLPSTTIDVGR